MWEEFGEAMEKDSRLREVLVNCSEGKAELGSVCVQQGRRTSDPDWGYCRAVERAS